ncbi:MAG: dihydroorotate dehydrogenase electron transfer subunit [Gemmataceae bacterium]
MQHRMSVVQNERLARDTYRIRLAGPTLASAMRPGQFVMLRIPGTTDPLLGRPFALYDTVVEGDATTGIDVVYLVVGKMTNRLALIQPGDDLEVVGPLGNGFSSLEGKGHVALVAGGIGQTPFLAYIRDLLGYRGYAGQPARRRVDRVSIYYGVRSADLAAGVEDFRQAGATVHLASDDGTLGTRGYVTELLQSHAPPDHLVGCGPEPMLHALASLAQHWGVSCEVSLETPMACGVGICFSCVTRVKVSDESWDYKRVCVDGPVFDSARLQW